MIVSLDLCKMYMHLLKSQMITSIYIFYTLIIRAGIYTDQNWDISGLEQDRASFPFCMYPSSDDNSVKNL